MVHTHFSLCSVVRENLKGSNPSEASRLQQPSMFGVKSSKSLPSALHKPSMYDSTSKAGLSLGEVAALNSKTFCSASFVLAFFGWGFQVFSGVGLHRGRRQRCSLVIFKSLDGAGMKVAYLKGYGGSVCSLALAA